MANRTLGAIPTELRNIQGHERLYAVDLNANVPRDRYLQLSTVIASAQVRNLGQFNISSQNRTVTLPADLPIGGSVFFSWSGGAGVSYMGSTTNQNNKLTITSTVQGTTINSVSVSSVYWHGTGEGSLLLTRVSQTDWRASSGVIFDTSYITNRTTDAIVGSTIAVTATLFTFYVEKSTSGVINMSGEVNISVRADVLSTVSTQLLLSEIRVSLPIPGVIQEGTFFPYSVEITDTVATVPNVSITDGEPRINRLAGFDMFISYSPVLSITRGGTISGNPELISIIVKFAAKVRLRP